MLDARRHRHAVPTLAQVQALGVSGIHSLFVQ
jgi:hypothetical protein